MSRFSGSHAHPAAHQTVRGTSGDRIPGIRAFGYPLGAKDYNDTVTKENESKTDDAELAKAKDALDAAQKEVEKAQEAVDAATSIEERNALIEKLNEAVEKKKRKTKDPNFSPAWKSSDLFYKIPPGRHSSILPDKLHRLVDHQIFPGGLFSGRLYASWHKAKVVVITMIPTTSAKRILI